MSTVTTAQQYRSNRRTFSAPAAWTTKAIRPTQLQQILSAGLLTQESNIEFLQVPRIVFHFRILGIGVWRVKRIPTSANLQVRLRLNRFEPPGCTRIDHRQLRSRNLAPLLDVPAQSLDIAFLYSLFFVRVWKISC